MQRPQLLDRILERTATRFLRSIHRITRRMPVKLSSSVQLRSNACWSWPPIPTMKSSQSGGNLALHQRLGSEVLTLFITLDAPAAPAGPVVRKGEAEQVARLLGFDHRFLAFPDGSVSLHEPAGRGSPYRSESSSGNRNRFIGSSAHPSVAPLIYNVWRSSIKTRFGRKCRGTPVRGIDPRPRVAAEERRCRSKIQ